jgi:hypothetical protein
MSASQSNTERFVQLQPGAAARGCEPLESLTEVVEAAARAIDDGTLNPTAGRQRLSSLDAKRLLALLTWCYVREHYSSAEIHARLRRAGAAELWDSGLPDMAAISQFRLFNRHALEACLKVALRHLAAQKVAEGFITRINDEHIAAEASRRIVVSMFTDCVDTTDRMAA